MSKLKKYIILSLILLSIIIALGTKYYYKNYMYSLEKVSKMLNSVEFPSNVCIEHKIYLTDANELITKINRYIKDNKEYIVQEDASLKENRIGKIEQIYDYDNKENIVIYHDEKRISSYEYEEMIPRIMPLKNNFFLYVQQHGVYEHCGKYEFHGKENVNGKQCIKVSFTDEYDYEVNVNFFYIDLETYFIIKYEVYHGASKADLGKTWTETYEYYPNTVTDEQILKFDKNNYPNYEFWGI